MNANQLSSWYILAVEQHGEETVDKMIHDILEKAVLEDVYDANNLIDFGRSMKTHTCDRKELFVDDEPANGWGYIGYKCTGCNKRFRIEITRTTDANNGPSAETSLIRECLSTSEGRKILSIACI